MVHGVRCTMSIDVECVQCTSVHIRKISLRQSRWLVLRRAIDIVYKVFAFTNYNSKMLFDAQEVFESFTSLFFVFIFFFSFQHIMNRSKWP